MMLNAADTAPVGRGGARLCRPSENAEKARPPKERDEKSNESSAGDSAHHRSQRDALARRRHHCQRQAAEIKNCTIMPAPTMNTRVCQSTAEITSRKSDRLSRAVPTYRSQLPA